MKQAIREIGIGVKLNISACRHILIAIARKYLGSPAGFEADEADHEDAPRGTG